MKTLEISKLQGNGETEDISFFSNLTLPRHDIDIAPWPDFPYKPKVQFSIAHNGSSLFVKFFAEEHSVRAQYEEINDPVYKDSCVEIFISLDDQGYYNFEFNCIGNCLAQFGPSRSDRKFLNKEVIEKITTLPSLGRKPLVLRDEPVNWELVVEIPMEVFFRTDITSLSGLEGRGNLYKCGDDTKEPHYLVWNPIETPSPDFHRPEFFGKFIFGN
ncbi:carbohydrate-binding family 9-like protein [Fulvivirgaceae bacterium BMA10]|uniref:Carbohydrate-binding family 9-like protein n=1 Tax=Splendidivirga corallicola TaxID=3051826 RepID=A0ABT8KNK5_9BACT|nr:carbohydrate-binding family 9-like protein [Fulvivirgaceae bacterium BMA10]